jgi:inorganic triphosphatase YgiF
MEIEAKFALPDRDVFQRLQTVDRLADFVLSAGQIKQVRDTYLDTAGRRILRAGYACRRREESEGILITLKGLGGAQGAVHRREELEVLMPSDLPLAEWPPSPVRERVLQLIGPAPLLPLFELQQARTVRLATLGERRVAELSLDDVCVIAGSREQVYLEMEVELRPQGTEDDLSAIVACLRDEWQLEPEPLSKFERALAFLGTLS